MIGEEARSPQLLASTGGKGPGGRWLYVSHEPYTQGDADYLELLGLNAPQPHMGRMPTRSTRYVHFKFEAMVGLRI